ncbi:MAG: 30S ribosomal protein S20 [Hyphomicrobiaceae bacterium]
MPNTKSAKRAERVTLRRTEVNKARRSRMRTMVRNVETALAEGNAEAAAAAIKAAEPVLMRTAQQGIVHKRTAARKVSRLNKRLKALAPTGQPSA